MNKIKKALEQFGKDYVYELTSRLLRYDKKASGELIRSIDYELLETTSELIDQSVKWTIKNYTGLKITAADYLIYVDEGRKKGGKMPPTKAIEPWIKHRNIKLKNKNGNIIPINQSAFIIARSIQRKGIKPTNVLEETRAAMLNKLNNIKEAYGEEILDGLKEVLKNIINN